MRLAPAIAVLAALLLSGCGFHPLYAVPGRAHGYMQSQMRAIYVAPASDRLGYALRNQMIDLLDGSADAKGAAYQLSFTIEQKQDAIGVQNQKVGSLSQTIITRYNDRMTVTFELTDNKTYNVTTRSGSSYVLDPELFGTSGLTSRVVLSLEDAHSDKIAAGKKNMVYTFVYQSPDATLTDDEVNKAHNKLREKIAQDGSIVLR